MSTENTLEVVVESSPAKLEITPPTNPEEVGEEILKTGDKLEIEDEEREKMLNEENTKKTGSGGGEVEKKKKALEEAAARQKEDTKRRIPIGGIRMPGFLRSRSRDKNKDGEEGEEGSDLLEPPCTATSVGGHDSDQTGKFAKLTKFKFSNPFNKKKKGESDDKTDLEPMTSPVNSTDKEAVGEGAGRTKGLINAIKLPLVNVIPRKLRSTKDKDVEEGTDGVGVGGGGGPAGLASMETLDDSNGSHNKSDEDKKDENGLETVKLDIPSDEKAVTDPEKAELNDEEETSKWSFPEWCQKSRVMSHFKDHQLVLAAAGIIVILLLFILIIIVAAFGPRPLTSAPIIDGKYIQAVTSCGNVEGILEDDVFIFRGIPYALPPEGDLRWMPPQPMTLKTCWNGTLKVHNRTPACWQKYTNGSVDGSEDCLTLDIITPHVRYDAPLPVVVLVSADTLTGGSPGDFLPSPRLSRTKEVIFVRPNFRLGPLGFLATGPLTRNVHPPTSGNYGLLDVVAALKWVKLNIQHFGGDSKMVTVLGYRAGATLVTALTSTRKPEELFARAWLSSGSAIFPRESLMESEKVFATYVEKLGCDTFGDTSCLKKQDVEELLDEVPENWLYQVPELPKLEDNGSTPSPWLILDGALLREHPSEVWKRENLKVKLVIGTTAHVEATKELKEKRVEWNAEDVAKLVRSSRLEKLGLSEEALRRYNTSWSGLAAMISDIKTICPLLTVATQIPETAFYVVTQPQNELVDAGADLRAILGIYSAKTPEKRRYVVAMQQMFYRFVAHGKFDAPDSDASKNRLVLVGQDPLAADEYPNCDFWISKDVVPRYARVD